MLKFKVYIKDEFVMIKKESIIVIGPEYDRDENFKFYKVELDNGNWYAIRNNMEEIIKILEEKWNL